MLIELLISAFVRLPVSRMRSRGLRVASVPPMHRSRRHCSTAKLKRCSAAQAGKKAAAEQGDWYQRQVAAGW
ncbi:hypothetical protein, partial [Streptomyces qinglanensis]|uniref:hypothetical protein n=1 Tax=Streptomyces qinglanensis TaxID=943816 RepID=UPI003D76598D